MSTSMKEFRDLSVAELQTKLTEARQELFNLPFQHAVAQLEKTHSIPVARMNIARILSALAEKGGQTTQSK